MYTVSIGKLTITSNNIKGLEKLLYTYLRYSDVQKTIKLAIAAKERKDKKEYKQKKHINHGSM